jgi:CDP-diacylglycerol--glycerol-3-phosphate 3-phosphatidyltransferase
VNAITFARVPLIFAWAVLAVLQELAVDGGCSLALAIAAGMCMLLSGLTDLWDGQLARKWNVVSPLGKMADPLMDKVFYLVAFPVLAWQTAHQGTALAMQLPLLALTVLYLLRDTWVTFLRSIGTMYGADVGAMWLGKVRTALSFPGAGWIYVYLALHGMVPSGWALTDRAWPLSVLAVEAFLAVLTLWSLVTYTRAYMPYLKRALERN